MRSRRRKFTRIVVLVPMKLCVLGEDRIRRSWPAALLSPAFEVHSRRIDEDRSVAQLCCADERRIVGFRSVAAGFRVHFAADIRPVWFCMAVSIQHGEHKMNEANVPGLLVDLKTRDEMPAGMAVVTLTSLTDLNRGLDFQAGGLALDFRCPVDEIGIRLMRVVLVGRMIVQRVAKHVRDKATEVVALNVGGQLLRIGGEEIGIDA